MIQTSQTPRRVAAVAVSPAVAGLLIAGLCGCGLAKTINNVTYGIASNRAAIKQITSGLNNAAATPFAATYITTGGSPVTVTYAVMPPTDVAFTQETAGGTVGNIDLVSNSKGQYSCTSVAGSGWVCQKLGKAQAVAQNQIADIYTPSHWVTFLDVFATAAGFAGDKVTNSTMTVNGFSMKCVDFSAKGVKGTSAICTTAQNILGYVKIAQNATSFELKSYTTNPAASLFQLPVGAKLTRGN